MLSGPVYKALEIFTSVTRRGKYMEEGGREEEWEGTPNRVVVAVFFEAEKMTIMPFSPFPGNSFLPLGFYNFFS